MLVGICLGLYWVLFSFFDHYIKRGEVIDFRLFRATGLAFAIRPKDIFKVHSRVRVYAYGEILDVGNIGNEQARAPIQYGAMLEMFKLMGCASQWVGGLTCLDVSGRVWTCSQVVENQYVIEIGSAATNAADPVVSTPHSIH